jgi:hypothetical protein
MRALRVEEQLEQYRESYARSMVEWNVQVDSLVVYLAFLAGPATRKEKTQKTSTIYNAIRYGWHQEQCRSCQPGAKKCKLLGCCESATSGYGTNKDGDGLMYAASDHHVEVVVADGLIVKSLAPSIPEMQDRPRAGDVTLGGNTILADKMIQPRQEKWHQYMAAAEHNPEKYSKVVSIPSLLRRYYLRGA